VATSTDLRLPRIGLLLAGGASSRMGQDKATLAWHGRPLIERMLERLQTLALDRVVVSGLRPAFDGIPDIAPARGPLGGIASAAQSLPDCDLLIVPVDMPQLGQALLGRLLDSAAGACVRLGDSPLPMRLRLDAELRTWLAAWLQDPDAPRALHRLQARVGVTALPLSADEGGQLVNVNTPAEWDEACARADAR
jgi:molybdenum cofactor guanylyltransferase